MRHIKSVLLFAIFFVIFGTGIEKSYANKLFHSDEDGFYAMFPSEPIVDRNSYDAYSIVTRSYRTETSVNNSQIIHAISFTRSSGTVQAYNKAAVEAYFKMISRDPIDKKETDFLGFKAVDIKIPDKDGRGILRATIFILDGEEVKIMVKEPSSISDKDSDFNRFRKSFNLVSVEKELSSQKWSNANISASYPVDWKERKVKFPTLATFSREGTIASLEVINGTKIGASCGKLNLAAKLEKDNSTGFAHYDVDLEKDGVTVRIVSACVDKNGTSYIYSGRAPKESFSRWERLFDKSLKAFVEANK